MNVAPERASVKPKFEGFFVPERREKPSLGPHEKIIVVSDLHGAKGEVINRLKAIPLQGEHKPAAVILAGDVAGNTDLEELQKLFYNHLTNHTKNDLLKDPNVSVSDNDLLSYRGKKPPYEGYTVKKGFLDLRRKELELEGYAGTQIEDSLAKLSDRDISDTIRKYAKYGHYGHYASNLSEAAVRKLAKGLRENAQALAEPLKVLRDAKVKVVINEGNWDPSPPIAFRRDPDDAEPTHPQRLLAAEQEESTGFSTQKFFEEQRIDYVTSIHVVETDTAALVLLPFDQLVRYSDMDIHAIEESERSKLDTISNAREKGKQVLVVQHGEVMWEPHNLTNSQSQPKGEHKKVIAGSDKINTLLKPDEVLHGHFHDPYVDEKGTMQPINTKYTVVFDNTPVVISTKDHAEGQAVVSYMQLQRFATVLIPYENDRNQRKISGFGGERQPAEVT